jgi:hypothetical protein
VEATQRAVLVSDSLIRVREISTGPNTVARLTVCARCSTLSCDEVTKNKSSTVSHCTDEASMNSPT